jgi:hypothetical protein
MVRYVTGAVKTNAPVEAGWAVVTVWPCARADPTSRQAGKADKLEHRHSRVHVELYASVVVAVGVDEHPLNAPSSDGQAPWVEARRYRTQVRV